MISFVYKKLEQPIDIPGYDNFRSERVKGKKAKRNLGGVIVFYKSNLEKRIDRLPSADKHFIWLKLNSSFFQKQSDIFLCCAYVPCNNSVYFKMGDTDRLDKLNEDIEKYSPRGEILIIGDLNSRLGNLQEECYYLDHIEDDNFETFIKIDLPLLNFTDLVPNTSGRQLITLMNDHSLVSLNGRKLGDTIGKLTCHEHNGSSTVDLALASWSLYEQIHFLKY